MLLQNKNKLLTSKFKESGQNLEDIDLFLNHNHVKVYRNLLPKSIDLQELLIQFESEVLDIGFNPSLHEVWNPMLEIGAVDINFMELKADKNKDIIFICKGMKFTRDELVILLSIPYQEQFTTEEIDSLNAVETISLFTEYW